MASTQKPKKKTYIKKIIKKRSSLLGGTSLGRNNSIQGSMESIKSISYDVTTIDNRRGTIKQETKLDSLDVSQDYTPSLRMMTYGSCDKIEKNIGQHQRTSKTKLLSTFMDLNKVESIKSIGKQQIFVEDSHKHKRRKYTIIKKKRHRDGSIESVKSNVYRNYGDSYIKKIE